MDLNFAQKKMKKQKINTYFKHKKKPIPTYTILRPFKFKFQGEWYESILYADVDSGEVYGRTELGFEESFKLVGDE